jgi:hypothetical protein
MPVNPPSKSEKSLYEIISKIIINALNKTCISVSAIMVEAYFMVGKRIIKQAQQGKERVEYDKKGYTMRSQLNTMCLAQNIFSMNKYIRGVALYYA